MPLGIFATGWKPEPCVAHPARSRTPINDAAIETDLCRMPLSFEKSIPSGLEHVIEADEKRNELRVEMRPEHGAARIGAAAAGHLGAEAVCVPRVHVVMSEQVPGLGSEAEARRDRESDAENRPEARHDIDLARAYANRHQPASQPAVRELLLIQEDAPGEAAQDRAAILTDAHRFQ